MITTTSDACARARLTSACAAGMSSRLASNAYGAKPTNATRTPAGAQDRDLAGEAGVRDARPDSAQRSSGARPEAP